MPRKGDNVHFRAEFKLQERGKRTNVLKVYIIWIQQKSRGNGDVEFYLKQKETLISRLHAFCEFLQQCFYLAKHTNKMFILSHTLSLLHSWRDH